MWAGWLNYYWEASGATPPRYFPQLNELMSNTTPTKAPDAAWALVVYPNPAHAGFAVRVPALVGAATVRATLLNALGQVVRQLTAALPAAGTTLAVETGGLAPGIYTLRLQAGPVTVARPVVLQ